MAHRSGRVRGPPVGKPPEEPGSPCRRTARLGIAVVAPDYRLTPENPCPAAFDDCHAAVAWGTDKAEPLGFDASRLALGGHSAGAAIGGTLARGLPQCGVGCQPRGAAAPRRDAGMG
ncbi:alpha/beta hydrolase [Streptomyces sp. NPDC058464]|uniref:alpha/beta hydrolase n=1 Tax=Streptomyces sp. NPDC058464 TaxID=3346511 RepID=UPI003663F21E